MSQFEAVQAGLLSGDAGLGLEGTSSPAVSQKIADVDQTWNSYSQAIENVLGERDASGTSLGEINHSANTLFAESNSVVQELTANQVSLTDLDQAGAQRMRVYRMAFIANSFIQADNATTRDALALQLHNTIMEFSAIQAGLRGGDSSLGLAGTSNGAVLAALTAVDTAWAPYEVSLESVLGFDPQALEALGTISTTAPALFTEANGTTGLVAADAQGVVGFLKQMEIVILGVALVILFLITWFIRATIVKPLTNVTNTARQVSEQELPAFVASLTAMAEGDLTQSITVTTQEAATKSGDEVGRITQSFNAIISGLGNAGNSFNTMTDNMNNLLGQVAGTSRQLADASSQLTTTSEQTGQASDEIARTNQQIARGAEEQARSVQDTTDATQLLGRAIDQIAKGSQEQASGVEQAASIVNQVSKATSEVAANAQSAAEGSRKANDAAQVGMDQMSKTVDGMGRIRTSVDSASSKISELGERSAEIGKIIAVIDDIAAQTNLLALNAAIEAARAGEQGRGFAVVADEVRQLAERVTESTKEIANLIDTVQKGVTDSITATEEGAAQVAEGYELADAAGESLKRILSSIEDVSQQVEQISAATEQVSASSDEMVTTIEGVSAIVEENSAATSEMATNSGQVTGSVESIASVAEENSGATQEASAMAEQVTAQVQQVVQAAQSFAAMAGELQSAVGAFKLKATQQVTDWPGANSSASDSAYGPSNNAEQESAVA